MRDFEQLVLMIVALVAIIGFVAMAQAQARKRGLEIDFLSPRGDPTRHILASLVLRGSVFRNTIIRNLRNPYLAQAAEPALEMGLIHAAAKKIEAEARPFQWLLVVGLLVVWFAPFLKFWLFLAWVGFAVWLQHRDRIVLIKPFEAASYDPAKLRGLYGASLPAPTTGVPVLVSGVFNPFIGLGLNLGGWNMALDVTRPAEGKSKTRALSAQDIETALTAAILSLNIPNLSIVDRLLVSGVETTSVPEVQPDRFVAPALEVSAGAAEPFHGTADERARVYRFATVMAFGGEVMISYAFRVLRRGSSLGVEVVHLAAAPLAPKFREIDYLRIMTPLTWIAWFGGAVIQTPLRLVSAVFAISLQLGELVDEILGGVSAREKREIIRNPAYNYGPRWSLRTHCASPNYSSWFQKADVQQYLRGLEEQVLNALRDCLEAHDVDVRAFSSQSMTVHNNNVQISSARDVNLQGVAIGQGAKASSVLGRLGLGSKGRNQAA